MSVLSSLLCIIAAAAAVCAGPIQRRVPIGSDKVVPLPQLIPSDNNGNLYMAYQPLLYVRNGCVPFPAIDAHGNTNAGLKPTGPTNGDCAKSEGQVYVRSGQVGGRHGIMYIWYFPKDEPSPGSGHRHDLEGVIVWLKSPASGAADNIYSICPSAHGGWKCSVSSNQYRLVGTRPVIEYASTLLNHEMRLLPPGPNSPPAGSQKMVAWEMLNSNLQTVLENADFGSAVVPFNNKNFQKNMESAAAQL